MRYGRMKILRMLWAHNVCNMDFRGGRVRGGQVKGGHVKGGQGERRLGSNGEGRARRVTSDSDPCRAVGTPPDLPGLPYRTLEAKRM